MDEDAYDTTEVQTRKRPLDDASNGRERKRVVIRTDQPLLKLLVPNYAAGAIIGKGGSLIGEMQTKYGGSIRLSANGECYPGTDERIVVVAGSEINQLIDYNNHIMERVKIDQNMPIEKRPRDERRGTQVKIVLPNLTAGLLIGKGGLTIKSIQEDTKAKVTIGSREDASVPGERVLTMSGSAEQRESAFRRVIEVIAEEPNNMANIQLKYAGGNISRVSAGNFGMGGVHPNNTNPMSGFRGGKNTLGNFGMDSHQTQYAPQSNPMSQYAPPSNPMSAFQGENNMNSSAGNLNDGMKLKTTVEVKMEVPDALVGGIMGKQGSIMRELHQRSGAKIRFSDKDDYAPGTTDRILTITGEMNAVHAAHDLINTRAGEVRNQLNNDVPRR